MRRWVFGVVASVWAVSALAQNASYDPRTAGQNGQAFGKQLQQQEAGKTPVFTAGGEQGAGTVTIAGQSIPVNELTPGANQAEVERLKALKDSSAEAMNAAAEEKKRALDEDPRASASAYRTIVNQQRADQESLSNDNVLWDKTRETMTGLNMGVLQSQYADCKATTTYFKAGTQSSHATHESSCEDLKGRDGATRERSVDFVHETETSFDQTLTVVQDSDLTFPVSSQVAGITSAEVSLSWQGNVREVTFIDYPSAFNSWQVGLHVVYDGTMAQTCSLPSGQVCAPGSLDCTCRPGPATVAITVTAEIARLKETLSSSPTDPLLDSDGFCTAHWKCDDSAPRTVGGTLIDGSFADVLTPLYPTRDTNEPPSSMAPLCWKASATYDCPYNLGNFGCWTTPSGQTQCHTNTAGNTVANTCGPLVTLGCQLLRRECVEGARGWGGTCYVENAVYNCPERVDVDSIGSRTNYECAGAVRCMGNDCLNDPQRDQAAGFATTQARLTQVQHMLSDTTLDTSPTAVQHPDGTSTGGSVATGNEVRLFRGEAYECRKALGSTVDCCSEADSGGEKLWMDLYAQHERRGNAQVAQDRLRQDGDPDRGAWSKLADPSQRTFDNANQRFTSRTETFRPNPQGAPTASTTASGDAIGHSTDMKPVMDEYRREKSTDEGMRNSWSCTAAEMDLAVQREAGACVNLGGYCSSSVLGVCVEKRDVYCCFNSPLTRAMRVQMAGGEQGILLGAFGTPKAPRCEGVAVSGVSGEVLNQTPLDDFIARMKKGDALPTLETLQARTSEERLTGNGSTLNSGNQSRPTVSTRTQARVLASHPDATQSALHAEASATVPDHKGEPQVVGVVGFDPGYLHAVLGEPTAIRVKRWGSVGVASVHLRIEPGTALPNVHYRPLDTELRWADGESGDKEISVETLRNTQAMNGSVRATLRLFNPSTGLRIDPSDEGALVFQSASSAPAPGPTTPALSFSKSLESASYVPADQGWLLKYRLIAANTGSIEVTNYTFTDYLPQGAVVRQWGDPADANWAAYCEAPGGAHSSYTQSSGSVAECRGASGHTIAPGTRIDMHVTVFVHDPVSVVTNECAAAFEAPTGARYATDRAQCHVATDLVSPPPVTAGCEGRVGSNHGYPTLVGEWNAYFGSFPGDGQLHSLPLRPKAVSAITAIPTTAVNGALLTLSLPSTLAGDWQPSPAVYARLSPCAGDVSLPTNSASDPFSMESCTSVAHGTGGAITNRPSLNVEFTDAFPSDEGTCRLRPGTRYYLNVVTNDPVDGMVSLQDDACTAPVACYVNVRGVSQ